MNWSNDLVITSYGTVVDENKLKGIDRSNAEDLRKLFSKLQSRMISDEFLDNPDDITLVIIKSAEFVGFVRHVQGKYAICISLGMLRAIWNLLLLSLCDPKIFPNYPEDESINYVPKEIIDRKLIFGKAIIPSINFPETDLKHQNITAARRELCETLYSAILDYIIYHECMHISRNHFEFFKFIRDNGNLDEATLKNQNARSFQLLEADADLVALAYSIESHPEIKISATLNNDQKGDFFFGFLFSYLIIQQLFDFDVMTKDEKPDILHPQSPNRAIFCSNLLKAYFKANNLLSDEELEDQENKAWSEASNIARKLQFPLGRWHGEEIADINFSEIDAFTIVYNQFSELINDGNESEDYRELETFMNSIYNLPSFS